MFSSILENLVRVLVTGGAGFIGSHLCEHLVGEGHAVVAVDNLSGGRVESVASIAGNPRFRLLKGDVRDPLFAADEAPFERIYHLACPASPLDYSADPLRTLTTCVQGTTHVLELAQKTGARFLLASTSEVYGDPLVHPQPESYWGNVNPIGPRACYDEGKRCAETFTMEYAAQRGVSVRIARIFNTYGPRMADDGRVIPAFVHQALRDKDLTVFGDGSQTRSYCYVDDLRDGLVRLMEHPESPGPVNLGNPEEITVLALARAVIEAIGSTKSAIVMRDLPIDDPKRRRPDIALARRILDFSPQVTLREGLERTIAAARTALRST